MWECLIQGGAEVSQGYGCTGVAMEPACATCAHWHSGIDLAAPCGREVSAGCAGTVVQIGNDPGYGPYAIFLERDVDGLVELYGHLQDSVVEVGQHVELGAVLGHVGSLGNSTGCHVHGSVRPPSDFLTECGAFDPAPLLCACGASPAPLLPPIPPVAPISALGILLLLDPDFGHTSWSPAAPGLGITWEP